MKNESANGYWLRNDSVSCCMEGVNGILFNADTDREKVINRTGLALWQAMDGVRDAAALSAYLADACETPMTDAIHKDTVEFTEELERDGMVTCLDVPSAEPLEPETLSRIEEAPRDFDLSLTGKCNLHCEYCFYADEMVGRSDLSTENWLAFFKELKSLAVRNVTLSGGEVFMRPDLWTLIDAVIEARLRYSILTNGTLITEKTLEAFSVGRRRQRLNSIQVSIDGSCAAVHDKSRGAGSFEKAVRGLRLLKEAGFPVTVRVTVNRHNVDDLDNVAHLLLEDIGLSSFSTNDAMAMGTGCTRQEAIVLTPEQRPLAMRTLVRLAEQYDDRISASAGSLALWRMFNEMEHAKATGEKATRWNMGTLSACGCMFLKLAVHHDGMIVPCNMLASASLGTIGQTPIASIWSDHPLLKEMRGRRRLRMEDLPGCKDCEWAPFCNGSCPATIFSQTGDLYRGNPDGCYRRFIETTKWSQCRE